MKGKWGYGDWLRECFCILCLLWSLYPLLFIGELPEGASVPKHYNFRGEVDSWGSIRWLYLPPILSFVLYIVLSVLERMPKILNYPVKVTENNREMLYMMAVKMLRAEKVLCMFTMGLVNHVSYSAATGSGGNYGWMIGVSVCAVIAPALYYTFKMITNGKRYE